MVEIYALVAGRKPVGTSDCDGYRQCGEGGAEPFQRVRLRGDSRLRRERHVGGLDVAVGADRFMEKLGIDLRLWSLADRLGREGKSPLYAAIDGRLAAVIAVADPIKPTTPGAIRGAP